MLGTRFDTMGGISSVVNVYRAAGLFDRWPVVYIPTHCDGSGLAKLNIAAWGFLRFFAMLLSGRVILVHIHISSGASFWRKLAFFLMARLFAIRTIVHLHSGRFHQFYEHECGNLSKAIVRYLFDNAERVIVLSSGWRRWLESISRNTAIVAIYNPVSVPPDESCVGEGKTDHVICLGRLGKEKGTYDLLEAVARIAGAYPDLKLTLAGDGDIVEVAKKLASIGLAARVCAPGWITGLDKELLLQDATIYCLPSYNEGLPMSVLEAMAYSLPVVATAVGGIPEAVADGREGFLITPGDVSALATRLKSLLDDPLLARRMGGAGRAKIVSLFSVETIVPQIERIYEELGGMHT
jgi:glycosyltransferase involved in cell wall biosynthesis